MAAFVQARTAKYEAKQELILNAAARLFNARGVRATTLSTVASEVKLATNSVTYYYKRKEDLAVACFLRSISAMQEVIETAASEKTSENRIRRFIAAFGDMLEALARDGNRDLVTFREMRSMTGADRSRLFDVYGQMFKAARGLFGKETGLSRRKLNARTHLLLTAAVWSRSWIRNYDVSDYNRVFTAIADMLVRGFVSSGSVWQTTDPTYLEQGGIQTSSISSESFLQAATRLVNEEGYVGASIDRICASLKVTKGSFYHHNDNKDELITACFERTFDLVQKIQHIAAERNDSGWGRLCDCAQLFVRYHLSPNGPLLRFSSWASLPEPGRTEMAIAINRLTQKFTGFFVDGMADGSLRIFDQSIASHLLSVCLNASAELQNWVDGVRRDEGAELYIKPLLTGILSRS